MRRIVSGQASMIEFTTILREDEHAYVVTIPLQAVIDFLRGGNPSVVLVDDVPMEFRFAREVMLEAQQYYIEHYADETRALLKEQGFEPKF
jgi:hypothetical protein